MSEPVANHYQPESVTPPGTTLADLLEERGIKQAELAVRMGVTPKFINELIAGKATISPHMALALERTLGLTANFWLTRDAHYQAAKARVAAQAELEAQADWLQALPLAEMISLKWVRKFTSRASQVAECLHFFGVASAAAWREQYVTRVQGSTAWRISSQVKHAEGSIAAWLRQAEIQASQLQCAPFDRDRLLAALQEARSLTLQTDPQAFIPRLQELFTGCGVAVLFVPAPKGCPASGAVRWLTPEKAVVQLSLRYKTNDHLWFTFFHECAHLLLHGKKMLFLEGAQGMTGGDEDEANVFARNHLIPPVAFTEFGLHTPTRAGIELFAKEIGIAPGIVVGRMQKEALIDWSQFNNLKVRYRWKDAEE